LISRKTSPRRLSIALLRHVKADYRNAVNFTSTELHIAAVAGRALVA
jgi:hypothetical protein